MEKMPKSIGSAFNRFINNNDVNTVITSAICLLSFYLALCAVFETNIIYPLSLDFSSEIKPVEIQLSLISLGILWITGAAVGKIFNLMNFPFVFGSLLWGIILINTPLSESFALNSAIELGVRRFALSILIVRWGICMNLEFMKSEYKMIFLLGLIPVIIEMSSLTLFSYFVFGWPFGASLLNGSLLAACSAPIIVPIMINLTNKGLGLDKKLPKIIPSSLCVDTFVCLLTFVITSNCVFTEESVTITLTSLAWKVILFGFGGALTGYVLWYFPKTQEGHTVFVRGFLCAFNSVAAIYGSFYFDCGYAGIVFILCMATVSCLKWRKEDNMAVFSLEKVFLYIWNLVACPMLFVLAGMKVKLEFVTWSVAGIILCFILLGAVSRIIAGIIVTTRTDYNDREKIIIILSMVPKATLQAALGPSLFANAETYPELAEYVSIIVYTAILSVVFTAPVRLFLYNISPGLLRKPAEPDFGPDEVATTTESEHIDEQNDRTPGMENIKKFRASFRLTEEMRKRRESESFS